ncbi:hypothetical protein [Aestuariivirga litoralis]|uniref:hypothetical protein n=1 Tax=Aestuariivirga litoralis TaxID=2650924 RepID=UPI0018C50816|nr:hypothetical protein [Aestuariivirga litoralis]
MIKLAIATLMTISASALAILPGGQNFGIEALFILLGLFVFAVASVNAVQSVLRA